MHAHTVIIGYSISVLYAIIFVTVWFEQPNTWNVLFINYTLVGSGLLWGEVVLMMGNDLVFHSFIQLKLHFQLLVLIPLSLPLHIILISSSHDTFMPLKGKM